MAKFVLSAFSDEAGVTLSEQIAALKENGIGYTEPRAIDGKAVLALTEDELRQIKCELDKNGIKVNSLGSPIGKYPIDEDFDVHLKDFYKAISACKILGTESMRMFSFFVPQERLSECRHEVLARLNKMCDIAKEHGIRLCHENESEIYGQMPEQMADLMANVKDLFGIFDAANYRMNGANVMSGIGATLRKLAYLHIKDAIYDTQTITPAGEGEGKLADIIDIVDGATDEVVYLTVEPHLFSFIAYQSIDKHELRGIHSFASSREAFDYAVGALKKLLTDNGFKEVSGVWTR